ncbi:tyrosine--tRNA ligase [Saccharicrinis aurantiacus]|uniref:tyrosine--tRNA ligase n=1 Tax=Saccharicrinis aurantiacus TaxID=1849719 RepID=UPI0008387AFE|nr:tyrosine--tRNA ligase [Saccharicrinis aurantiacus]
MNFVEELKWRGMVHDMMPGTEELLQKEMTSAYVGIDPTADSLHIGHLVSVMMLKHLQVCGHRPIVLVGGATGMIGDPSGKSDERNLLDEETLQKNQDGLKAQLSRFLDFEGDAENKALMVNNYDWMKEFSFLGFIRDIGKHITVNYMMAKDSVKKRITGEANSGLSFTEFTYQLVQGTDFYHLYNTYNCKLQMGGSDQWGNITTGTELIRRMAKEGEDAKAYALTCPLITKADGGKFGKTESGNIWLDPARTSPYKFYQFWLNTSDADAEKYIKIFTLLSQEEVSNLAKEHAEAPHARALQKRLAEEITVMVHGREAYDASVEASQILFGKATTDALKKIDEDTFLAVFEGVPTHTVAKADIEAGLNIVELLATNTNIFPSKGEARKTIKGGGVSLNKEKVANADVVVNTDALLNNKYLLAQKGKKNYFVIIAE